MAKTATKSTVKNIDDVNTVEEMNENMMKATKKSINTEPLEDSDEIEVVSLVSNVSYKDSKTLDTYEWREIGHVEYMTFETLKNMWRNNKGYFKNLWLKPNDDRVINKFSLTKTFEKYEYLMDGSNYTKKNIGAICTAIKSTPNGLKWAICDKVKSLVINGEITNISVIRELEKSLRIDLISFLD
jgi:hypothetical protein